MGRHNDPADRGSRRAVLLTLVASVLLVVAGVMILLAAGDLRVHRDDPEAPPTSPTSSATTTP
jgi:hypothetical protein